MEFRSGIYEAVAVSPVRKTMFFAAALLGLLVIFGASGDTVFAKGRPAADFASATLVQVDRGDLVLSPIPGIDNEVFIGSFGGNGIDGMPNGSQIRADQSSRFVPSPTEENPNGIIGVVFGTVVVDQGAGRSGNLTVGYLISFFGTFDIVTGAISVEWSQGLDVGPAFGFPVDEVIVTSATGDYSGLSTATVSMDATATAANFPAPEVASLAVTVTP